MSEKFSSGTKSPKEISLEPLNSTYLVTGNCEIATRFLDMPVAFLSSCCLTATYKIKYIHNLHLANNRDNSCLLKDRK